MKTFSRRMFRHISQKGRLRMEEAIKFLKEILAQEKEIYISGVEENSINMCISFMEKRMSDPSFLPTSIDLHEGVTGNGSLLYEEWTYHHLRLCDDTLSDDECAEVMINMSSNGSPYNWDNVEASIKELRKDQEDEAL